MKSAVLEKNNKIPDSWLDLIKGLYPLYPIHNETNYKKAIHAADLLTGFDGLNKEQLKYLETLSMLIEDYEKKNVLQKFSGSPIDALKFLMKENNLTASDIGNLLGDRTLGCKIVSGDRQLSKAHILKLAEYFSVDPSLFL